MKAMDRLFSSKEQARLFKALQEKDYLALEKLINNDEEKAKMIFQFHQELMTLSELDSLLSKTTFSKKLKDEDSQGPEKKITIQIKDNFLNLITGQSFLKPAISGLHRSNREKTDALQFNGFTISKKKNEFVFSRDGWFKKLIISSNRQESGLEEKKIIKEKNYYTVLTKGNYFIHIDGEEFFLELH